MNRPLRSALVVEDDFMLRTGIAAFLRSKGLRVATAASAAEAIAQLSGRPSLLLIDVVLPDGSAFHVLDAARTLAPSPTRVAMSGKATPEDAFLLARHGVRRFLQKPVTLDEIWKAVSAAHKEAPNLAPFVREAVGRISLKSLTSGVRGVAVRQALAISHGNRTRAAHLLQITRQAVQQIMRRQPRAHLS